MSEVKSYRHRVTGLVSELHPMAARAMGDLVEEVPTGSKPRVPLNDLVAKKTDRVTTRAASEKPKAKATPAIQRAKEKKDV